MSDLKKGGFKMIANSHFKKKFMEVYPSPWKSVLNIFSFNHRLADVLFRNAILILRSLRFS